MYTSLKDILHEALKYDILSKEDLENLEARIEVQKREQLLSQHNYSIWQGRNGSWYTKLPVDDKLKLIRKKDKLSIEEIIINFYKEKLENPTINELFFQWLNEREKFGEIRESSMKKYTNDFKRFIECSELGKIRIRNLTEDELYTFVKTSITTHELTAKSFAGLRTILNGILKYAKRKKYTTISVTTFFHDLDIAKNCFKKTRKKNESERLTDEEVRLIIHYISEHPSIRNLAIMLCLQTGMRIGELATLKPEDINYHTKTIHIQRTETTYNDEHGKSVVTVGEYPKTDESDRYVIILDSCINIIRQIRFLNPSGVFLFEENGKRIRANALRRAFYRICDNVKIARRSPHCIRKTYASTLLDNYTDESLVKNQLGHTDIATTRKYYQFCRKDENERREQIAKAINY